MTDSLRRRCELLVGNRVLLKREFKFDNTFFNTVGAGLFASSNEISDVSKVNHCRDLIKKNTGLFSKYRSFGKISFAILISLEADPKAVLYRMLDLHAALKKYFSDSYYLAFAAYLLAKHSKRPVTELASRTNAIYKMMRSLNRRETAQRDIIYAAIRATEAKLNAEIASAEQTCSEQLEGLLPKYQKRRVVHNIALFSNEYERAGCRLSKMISLLRDNKYKYGKCYELNVLAVLAMTEIPEEDIVESIIEVFEYLHEKREFSRFLTKREILMHSAFAVLDENLTPQRMVAVDTAMVSTLAEFSTVIVSQLYY